MKQYPRQYLACGAISVLSALANACALTSKAEPVNIRYFNPERTNASHVPTLEGSSSVLSPVSLRLGRVKSSHHLRDRMVYQSGDFELGYYDELRWLERPEVYAERAVSRALFERRAIKHVLAASAPTLEVEVSAFHEVRVSTGDYAYVQLHARIIEMNEVIWRSAISAREPIEGSRIEGVVVAMAGALETATESLAKGVGAALSGRANMNVAARDR
jgi:ABC-type uncharacterized transport system auxiliary subunit